LSKIIKQASSTATVSIGEKHHDFELEARAEERLADIFPSVTGLTDLDGAVLSAVQ